MLNRSKGPAVRGPAGPGRPRRSIAQAMQAVLAEQPSLTIEAAAVEDLVSDRPAPSPAS